MLQKKVEKKFPTFPPMALIPWRCKAERVGNFFKIAKKFPTFDIKFPTLINSFPHQYIFVIDFHFSLAILLPIYDLSDIIEV